MGFSRRKHVLLHFCCWGNRKLCVTPRGRETVRKSVHGILLCRFPLRILPRIYWLLETLVWIPLYPKSHESSQQIIGCGGSGGTPLNDLTHRNMA